ncbi:MAG: redoxin domain-containing protein, partial [Candidatus Eisenbacteria bacterium]|nr:redoxin domain-containing protein [Candidatus Eisenbacteria bacterium]
MKKWNLSSVAALVIALVIVLAWAGESRAEVETNKPAPDFSFTDIEGASGKLSDFKGKVVVLEWFNHSCPFVRKHYDSNKMQNLQRKYTEKEVVWIAINSTGDGYEPYRNEEESVRDVDSNGTSATYVVLDPDGKIGALYGAKTTPHIFIINEKGTLVYQGAADDIK